MNIISDLLGPSGSVTMTVANTSVWSACPYGKRMICPPGYQVQKDSKNSLCRCIQKTTKKYSSKRTKKLRRGRK